MFPHLDIYAEGFSKLKMILPKFDGAAMRAK